MTARLKRDKLFISYSHKDKKWLERLRVFLKPSNRAGLVEWWDDTKLTPGSKWREEIRKAVNSAKVAVLLISADFFASDFIAEYELPPLLDAAENEGAKILPVIVGPSRFKRDKSLSEFQAVNDPSRPLIKMTKVEQEELWDELTARIEAELAAPSTVHNAEDPDVKPTQPRPATDGSSIPLTAVPGVGIVVDRQDDIKAIEAFLANDAPGLVIVQGLAGIGKTTVTAQLVKLLRGQFKAVLWTICRAEQATADILFARLNTFFEQNDEPALHGVWDDARPDHLEAKIEKLVRALAANSYLLIFDELENWLSVDFELQHGDLRDVLGAILRADHQSKVVFVTDRRPLLDPTSFPLPTGSTLERTLLGLSHADAVELLHELHLEIDEKNVLDRIIDYCDGNPFILQVFAYQVTRLRRDPNELLRTDETGTKFSKLLQTATRDLSPESYNALELLSTYRLPVGRDQLQESDIRFHRAIGPLLDRFVVVENEQTRKISISSLVRSFVKGNLTELRSRELHQQAVQFYVKNNGGRIPQNYVEAEPLLEESHHRFESGDLEGGARTLLLVVPRLIDWGYLELAEQKILQAVNTAHDNKVIAQCSWLLGSIADLRAEYPKALEHFAQALNLNTLTGDFEALAQTLFRIGRIYNALNLFKEANDYFQRCIRVCEEHSVNNGWGGSLLGMAWNLQERSGDVGKAIQLYSQSIERAEQSGDTETLSTAHRQIGFLLWTKKREKEKARQNYEQALQISEQHHLVKDIAAINSELGYLYDEWGENAKAEQSCNQAIKMFKMLGDEYGLAGAYLNLGKVWESRQEPRTAVHWYDQSRNIYTAIKNPGGQAYASLRLGKLLFREYRIAEAHAVLSKAVSLSKDYGLSETMAAAESELARMVASA